MTLIMVGCVSDSGMDRIAFPLLVDRDQAFPSQTFKLGLHPAAPRTQENVLDPPPPSGSVIMSVHRRRRGGGRPPLPDPPPPLHTKVTIVGTKRNLQRRKSGRAIFGTQLFGPRSPPPPF